jgi:hypothetical protein
LQVYALGFVSVFDQILDGFDAGDKEALFGAYVKAIGEDPAQYRVSGQPAARLAQVIGDFDCCEGSACRLGVGLGRGVTYAVLAGLADDG